MSRQHDFPSVCYGNVTSPVRTRAAHPEASPIAKEQLTHATIRGEADTHNNIMVAVRPSILTQRLPTTSRLAPRAVQGNLPATQPKVGMWGNQEANQKCYLICTKTLLCLLHVIIFLAELGCFFFTNILSLHEDRFQVFRCTH